MNFYKVTLPTSLFFLIFFQACTDIQENITEINTSEINRSILGFNPEKYICYRADNIVVDGDLKDESWSRANWTSDFVDIEGKSKPDPLYKTRAKMLWDNNYLYIAAEIFEPDIWAYLKQRDTVIFYDNDFEVFIDPDGDTHGYYEFEVNALNTVWDLLLTKPYRDHGKAIDSWDIVGLQSAVKIFGSLNKPDDTDTKWTVELAFPFTVLEEWGNRPAEGTQWRINFSRVNWKTTKENGYYKKEINPETGKRFNEFNWVWSAQGLINMHAPEKWAYLQFSDILAGDGETVFIENPEEKIKWNLRKLYYAQREYASKNKSYTKDLKKLSNYKTENYKVSVLLTMAGYEASILTDKKIWIINETGRVYSIKKIEDS